MIKGLDAWLTREQEFGPCEVCGKDVDNCICPECPVCNSFGDPNCYKEHGLVRTDEQIASLKRLEDSYKAEAEAEAAYIKQYLDDQEL